jgi:hypothetical protein
MGRPSHTLKQIAKTASRFGYPKTTIPGCASMRSRGSFIRTETARPTYLRRGFVVRGALTHAGQVVGARNLPLAATAGF